MHLTAILDWTNLWTQSAISTLGYPGLGLVMFLENVFPPIPSEIVLPLAGSLTLQGRFTLTGVALVGALGSIAGALFLYGLGHRLGEARVHRLVERYGRWVSLSAADFDRFLVQQSQSRPGFPGGRDHAVLRHFTCLGRDSTHPRQNVQRGALCLEHRAR